MWLLGGMEAFWRPLAWCQGLLGSSWGRAGGAQGPPGGSRGSDPATMVSTIVSAMVSTMVSGAETWGFEGPQGEGREGAPYLSKAQHRHKV